MTVPALLFGLLAVVARPGEYVVQRDFRYGARDDAPTEGRNFFAGERWTAAGGRLCHTHRSGQYYDLLRPKVRAPGVPLFLHLHGGAWSQRFDKDGADWSYVHELVVHGVTVATMDYQLQEDLIGHPFATPRPGATFAEMLRDIDAMVTHLADHLPALGLPHDAILIGGESAGAHLAALYAADEANPGCLGLTLRHRLKIRLVVDVAGPVDLTEPRFCGVQTGLSPVGFFYRKLFGALTGTDLAAAFARRDTAVIRATMAKWSPVSYVNDRLPPVVMLYSRLAGTDHDGLVGVSALETMRAKLKAAGVRCWTRIDEHVLHCTSNPPGERWLAETVVREVSAH